MPDCLELGGGSHYTLGNVIVVTEDTVVFEYQLSRDQVNVILIMTAGITVTLPVDDPSRIVVVHQGFEGSGTYTVN